MGIANIYDNNIDDIDIDGIAIDYIKYMHTNTLMNYLEAHSLWLGLVNCGFSCSMS